MKSVSPVLRLGAVGVLGVAALLVATVGCSKPKETPAVDAAPPRPVAVHTRAAAAPGELPADLVKSKITVSIIKDRDTKAPVIATLMLRDGAVSLAAGTARLTIDIDSFESGIPLRNERVRGVVFETSGIGWDTAELTISKVPDDLLASLREKKIVRTKLDADMKIHGKTAKLSLPVEVAQSGGAVLVKTTEPMALKASDFDLTPNVRRLSQICMHDSIDDAVSVEVALEFR